MRDKAVLRPPIARLSLFVEASHGFYGMMLKHRCKSFLIMVRRVREWRPGDEEIRAWNGTSARATSTRLFIAACLFLASAFVTSAPASAQNLIRDTEIENAIRVYMTPLMDAAGLDPYAIKIHIVNNNALNAFVSNGQQVFIHTGLLMRAESPLEVMGVLAHELGHVAGGHLARFGEGLENAQTASVAALLLGIPAAILSGRAEAAAAAASLGTQIGTRSLLTYTREMEQAADQAGVGYLDQAGYSSEGLRDFMAILKQEQALTSDNRNPYIQTHPLTDNRIRFIESHIATSPQTGKPAPDDLVYIHNRTRAKLIGYLLPEQVDKIYPPHDISQPARYARIIAAMRTQDFETALSGIDAEISATPDDVFLYELKGDILRNAGRVREAIDPYRKAVEMLPWAALIRSALAQMLLQTNDIRLEDEAMENAIQALRYDSDLISAYRAKGTVHERRGERGQAVLAQAEAAIRGGDRKRAKEVSDRAMALLPEGSAGWLRAQDINIQASRDDKK